MWDNYDTAVTYKVIHTGLEYKLSLFHFPSLYLSSSENCFQIQLFVCPHCCSRRCFAIFHAGAGTDPTTSVTWTVVSAHEAPTLPAQLKLGGLIVAPLEQIRFTLVDGNRRKQNSCTLKSFVPCVLTFHFVHFVTLLPLKSYSELTCEPFSLPNSTIILKSSSSLVSK